MLFFLCWYWLICEYKWCYCCIGYMKLMLHNCKNIAKFKTVWNYCDVWKKLIDEIYTCVSRNATFVVFWITKLYGILLWNIWLSNIWADNSYAEQKPLHVCNWFIVNILSENIINNFRAWNALDKWLYAKIKSQSGGGWIRVVRPGRIFSVRWVGNMRENTVRLLLDVASYQCG